MKNKPTAPREVEIDDTELGLIGLTTAYSTVLDVRRTLELRSSDPSISAFELLVRPNRPWLKLDDAQRREIGARALDRYCSNGGDTSAATYSDLLEDDGPDSLSYVWTIDRYHDDAPVGKRS